MLSTQWFGREPFGGQLPGEVVVFRARRHPFFLFRSLLFPTVLGCGAIAAEIALILGALEGPEALSAIFWTPLIALLVALLWGWAAYSEWGNDYALLTSRRLISNRKVFRLFEERREAELMKIQDITVRATSVFAFLLNYADVVISTASASGPIELPALAEPEKLKEAIFQAREALAASERERDRQDIRERLRREFRVESA